MIVPRLNLLPYAKCPKFHPSQNLRDIERFMAKVYKLPSGCWIWTCVTNKGYGKFSVKHKYVEAHRWSYEYHCGPIPEGLEIDHLCRVTACVNPDHLEPVTRRINQLRGFGLAGTYARRTYCKHGHEYTTENTRAYGTSRVCRTCDREWKRREAKMKKDILERIKPTPE